NFIVAAVMYRRQPAIVQCLILAVPLQFATIALHQTRFPRFLLLPVVLLCLATCAEVGRWLAGSSLSRALAALVAPVPLVRGVVEGGREGGTVRGHRVRALHRQSGARGGARLGSNGTDRVRSAGDRGAEQRPPAGALPLGAGSSVRPTLLSSGNRRHVTARAR